jgi:hypothetical protein
MAQIQTLQRLAAVFLHVPYDGMRNAHAVRRGWFRNFNLDSRSARRRLHLAAIGLALLQSVAQ